jgi:hypothetical protein
MNDLTQYNSFLHLSYLLSIQITLKVRNIQVYSNIFTIIQKTASYETYIHLPSSHSTPLFALWVYQVKGNDPHKLSRHLVTQNFN